MLKSGAWKLAGRLWRSYERLTGLRVQMDNGIDASGRRHRPWEFMLSLRIGANGGFE